MSVSVTVTVSNSVTTTDSLSKPGRRTPGPGRRTPDPRRLIRARSGDRASTREQALARPYASRRSRPPGDHRRKPDAFLNWDFEAQ